LLCLARPQRLEKELQRQLADARIASLIQGAEVSLRAELGKITGGGALVEVYAVQEIEKLGPELELDALGEGEIFGQPQIPGKGARKTQAPLAEVAKRARRVGHKRSQSEPILASFRAASAGSGAVRGTDEIGSVLSNPRAGIIRS